MVKSMNEAKEMKVQKAVDKMLGVNKLYITEYRIPCLRKIIE